MDSDRIYQADDAQWYFNVRGNQRIGPFGNYNDAETALHRHVNTCHRRVTGGGLWPNILNPLRARRQRTRAPQHT